ncbi:twin-arginine translocase TatA/TatE family subunit [Thiothrix subterranea]|uniref:Sec-independent protein translocase protein TatA n=1 Tax=Thiothrix subterranea TaxID=2735563 RepID=A0AA51QXF6_9GAMM|nr:twin-arginine translocase TatA/TatE family subunit [Thiothrix subterranea]MDQ5768695.1 twin-arginine translocase TatA/TatE family subunit [Thiothrix subterranea]WML84847.1 twin-arginine translocase TatA/TatE family subunit [Thiothrix subterranea]
MHFSPLQLAVVLVIIILLFGTKKLRNMGGDLGEALKGFRRAVRESDDTETPALPDTKGNLGETRVTDPNTGKT